MAGRVCGVTRSASYAILFRDYLRAHPVASAAYALIKLNLSRRHPDDVGFYYDIKDPLCDIVIDAAEEWARVSGWQAAFSPE